jgi:hypothetical protein
MADDITVNLKAEGVPQFNAAMQSAQKARQELYWQEVKLKQGLEESAAAAKYAATTAQILGNASKEAGAGIEQVGRTADKTGQSLGRMAGQAFLAYQAFRLVQQMIASASGQESGAQKLSTTLGGSSAGVVKQLQEVSKATNIHMEELEAQAGKLSQAGVPTEKLASTMQALGVTAKATGMDLSTVVSIYDQIAQHGSVSGAEMIAVTAATDAATRKLAVTYSHLKEDYAAAGKMVADHTKALRESFDAAEKQTNNITRLTEKIGLNKAVYNEWAKDTRKNSVTIAEGFSGPNIGAWSTAIIAQAKAGIAQLATESNLSEDAIKSMVKAGLLGQSDLESAYGRSVQAAKELAAKQGELAAQFVKDQEKATTNKMLDSFKAALESVTTSQSDFIAYQGTFAGKIEKLQNDVDQKFAEFGAPFIHSLELMEGAVTVFFGVFAVAKLVPIIKGFAEFVAGMVSGFGEVTAAATTAAAAETAAANAGKGGGGGGIPTPGIPKPPTGGLGVLGGLGLIGGLIAPGVAAAELAKTLVDTTPNSPYKDNKTGMYLDPMSTMIAGPDEDALTGEKVGAAKIGADTPGSGSGHVWSPLAPATGSSFARGEGPVTPLLPKGAPRGAHEAAMIAAQAEAQSVKASPEELGRDAAAREAANPIASTYEDPKFGHVQVVKPSDAEGGISDISSPGKNDAFWAKQKKIDALNDKQRDVQSQMRSAQQGVEAARANDAGNAADKVKADEIRAAYTPDNLKAYGPSAASRAAGVSGSDQDVIRSQGLTPQGSGDKGSGGSEQDNLKKLDELIKSSDAIKQALIEIFKT